MNDITSRLSTDKEADLAQKLKEFREPHASDCAVWVNEECDCETGKDERETRLSWEHAR